MKNEVEQFFEGLPSEDKREADIFGTNQKPTENVEPAPKKEDEEGDDEPRKNRRHRRLEEALQKERESNIALNERVKTLAELAQERNEEKAAMNVDERFVRLFGADENGKEISRHFTEILNKTRNEAEENALKRFNEQQQQVLNEQKGYESFIDDQLETLEDTYNVDLTSDSPKARKSRREFLELIEKVSPKDQNGDIVDYADFGSTFDIYQSSMTKADDSMNRRKEIASRSIQRESSAPAEPAGPQGPMTFERAKAEINRLLNQ